MKKVYFFLAAFGLLYKPAGAQVSIQPATAQQLVEKLVGNGIQIVPSSIRLYGMIEQTAIFNFSGPTIGMKDGILLSSGYAAGVLGPNNDQAKTQKIPSEYVDSDLGVLGTTHDASVLEFDFIPGGKTISFKFVFASDEYDEFVDRSYHDAFALLVSGPNVQGDQWANGTYKFSNQAKNLATIGGQPISVGTINANSNSGYYTRYPDSYPAMQCDGYTAVFTPSASNLICDGSTRYHLKIVIGDINDQNVDAWLFLQGNSLKSSFEVGQINELGPLCEGQPYQLSITGAPGTYVWSTGDTAQTTTVIANSSNPSYTVTASNAEGCSITRSTTLNVYTSQNQPPYCTGINGTGKFTYYAQAGRAFCFNLPHADPQSKEKVTAIFSNQVDLPIGASFSFPNNDNKKVNNPLARFCWQPGINDIGEFCFTVVLHDDNGCEQDTSVYNICIRVYCQGCDSSVYYQMRSQASGFPLPARTAAAQRIVAGNKVVQGLPQGKVIVSSGEQVHFKAGLEIVLDTGFIAEAGSEFTAEIDETTCTSNADCNFCCRYWTGWNDIHVPNVITPNGDGQNDYFTIGRWSAPGEMGCLPNLTCYELEIFNRWGVRVYQNSYNAANVPGLLNPYQCCYISNLLIPGWHNLNVINWGGNGHDDDFFYVLKLCSGCDGEKTFNGTLKVMGSNELQAPLPGAEEPWQAMAPASLRIVPNPGNGIFELWTTGLAPTEKAELEICNAAGQPVYKQTSYHTGPLQINLGQAPKGIYYLKMNSGQRLFVKKIVIQ